MEVPWTILRSSVAKSSYKLQGDVGKTRCVMQVIQNSMQHHAAKVRGIWLIARWMVACASGGFSWIRKSGLAVEGSKLLSQPVYGIALVCLGMCSPEPRTADEAARKPELHNKEPRWCKTHLRNTEPNRLCLKQAFETGNYTVRPGLAGVCLVAWQMCHEVSNTKHEVVGQLISWRCCRGG